MLAALCILGGCADDFVSADDTGTSEAGESGDETGDDAEIYECEPATPLASKPPVLGWQTELDSNNDDTITDLAVAADGSVIVVGSFAPFDTFDYDAFATKLGPDGDEQWSRVWSSPSTTTTHDAVELAADGSILILGSSGEDLTLTSLTPDGEDLSLHTWNDATGPGQGRALALGPTGRIYIGTVNDSTPHVSRVSEAGEIEWQTDLAWSSPNVVRGLAAACDGSIYVIGGYVDEDYWMDDGEGIVAKLDDQGNVEWEVFSGVGGVDEYIDIALVSDAVYVVGNAFAHAPSEYTGASFVSRIDPTGELVWTEYVHPPDSMGAIAALGDGVVVGHATNSLVHFAPDGQIVWTATADSLGNTQIPALAVGPDASLLVAGPFWGDGSHDISVSRLDQP